MILLCKHWGSHSALDYLVKNWICSLRGPEDDSIESKHVAHVSMVVDIAINCCVRLLYLVPMLLIFRFTPWRSTGFHVRVAGIRSPEGR